MPKEGAGAKSVISMEAGVYEKDVPKTRKGHVFVFPSRKGECDYWLYKNYLTNQKKCEKLIQCYTQIFLILNGYFNS